MEIIKIIAFRELKAFFDSLTAYILLALFLGLTGFFTWVYGSDVFYIGQASMQSFFAIAYWTLFFFAPALTMKMISEEKKTGTIELMLTKPITDMQLIAGKYLGALLLIVVALALTLPYYFSIMLLGPIDHAAVLSGYLGLLLMSSALIGIGLFASSISNNQIVSFLISLAIGILFLIFFDLFSQSTIGITGALLSYLSMVSHYDSITKGIIDLRDILYFVSFTFIGLFSAEWVLSKRMVISGSKKSKTLLTNFLMVVVIVIVANGVASKLSLRLDFTEDKRYTLSEASKKIIDEVKQPLTITAYFSDDLPPVVAAVKRDFKDMLIEYSNRSGGNIIFEFVNPNKDKESEMKAEEAGIKSVIINTREKDNAKQQRAYLGAVLKYGSKSELIAEIKPGAAMEFDLSTAIKKLSGTSKSKLGLVQSESEASMQELPQLVNVLNLSHSVEPVFLSDSTPINPAYKALLIVAPSDSFKKSSIAKIESFVASGGRVFVAYSRVKSNLKELSGSLISTGLEDWLMEKGLQLRENILLDANCGNVYLQQGGMKIPVQFPYLPIIQTFAKHPTTVGIDAMILPFSSTIYANPNPKGVKITPLAFSSEKSGAEKLPVQFDVEKRWTEDDFKLPKQVVAVAVEGNISGNNSSKLAVITSSAFIINANNQRVEESNVNFAANIIDWLSDDSGLADLRTKGQKMRPLDPSLTDGGKSMIKYFNLLLPLVVTVIIGSLVRKRRQDKIKMWISSKNVE